MVNEVATAFQELSTGAGNLAGRIFLKNAQNYNLQWACSQTATHVAYALRR